MMAKSERNSLLARPFLNAESGRIATSHGFKLYRYFLGGFILVGEEGVYSRVASFLETHFKQLRYGS